MRPLQRPLPLGYGWHVQLVPKESKGPSLGNNNYLTILLWTAKETLCYETTGRLVEQLQEKGKPFYNGVSKYTKFETPIRMTTYNIPITRKARPAPKTASKFHISAFHIHPGNRHTSPPQFEQTINTLHSTQNTLHTMHYTIYTIHIHSTSFITNTPHHKCFNIAYQVLYNTIKQKQKKKLQGS